MTKAESGRIERASGARARLRDPVVLTVLYLVAVSAVFIAFPAIDMTVAGLFHTDAGFPASKLGSLIALRGLGDQLVILVVLVLFASLAAKIAWPLRPMAIRPRTTVFLLASLALGPGLVVNGILKTFSGRPRPYQVDLFGGAWPFQPAWHFSAYCPSNCSFVAGEASTAAWLLALVLLAPPALRLAVAVPIALVGLALSVNRMAFGGHFLSDVMLAWGITFLIVLVLHRLLVEGPLGRRIDRSVSQVLVRAGFGLRQRLARRGG